VKSFGERLSANDQRDRELAAAVRREMQQGLATAWPQFEPSFFDHPDLSARPY
jgi:hypothetical protein